MDNKTYINAYEESALINTVNDFSSELEKYRVGIFIDGPHMLYSKNTDFRFEVQLKGAVSAEEENTKELKKVSEVVEFLNSMDFIRDMVQPSETGITKKERLKLEDAFAKGIKQRKAEPILKVLGTVHD